MSKLNLYWKDETFKQKSGDWIINHQVSHLLNQEGVSFARIGTMYALDTEYYGFIWRKKRIIARLMCHEYKIQHPSMFYSYIYRSFDHDDLHGEAKTAEEAKALIKNKIKNVANIVEPRLMIML